MNGQESEGINNQETPVQEASGQRHQRRKRYSGAYPRRFDEKYKELQPEKYGDTIEKVIRKGNTPAGMHLSICVEEILAFFQIQPGQRGLDATLGYGGHTQRMLECLKGSGHLTALDVDPIESAKTRERLARAGYGPELLTVKLENFANIDRVAQEMGKFDFILADLGVSSMQIDNPSRGFTYKAEGPLDLRMNPLEGVSASDRLLSVSRDELIGMLQENSDEPYAKQIAGKVAERNRRSKAPWTTTELHGVIRDALNFLPQSERQKAVQKSSQRTFQALRIDVNHEFEVLYQFLEKLPDVLAPGGKVAILTFHSGEDRLVKQSFRDFYRAGLYQDIAREVIRPSAQECARNSRAHSTKMRWAIRQDS